MASMDSTNDICVQTKSVPHCVVLSSVLSQIPFLKPIRPNLASPNIIRELHDSIASAADNVSRFFDSMVSQNPILKKISSFSSDFNRFAMVCRRNYSNVNSLSSHNFAAIIPGDSVAGLVVANGLQNFLNLYNTVLVCRLVLTWFPNAPPAIVGPLSTICDPYLNLFRGIIPPLGGTLDLSPILAFLVLNALTSTAAALPAELPKKESCQEDLSSLTSCTTSENKWMKRLCGSRSKKVRVVHAN